HVYCPKQIRDYFLHALRVLEGEQGTLPLTVGQMIGRARLLAEVDAAQDQLVFRFWPIATDAVLELLLQSGCLYEVENVCVRPGMHARGTTIVAIAPDLEVKCEL